MQRVVLLSFDKDTGRISFRHYGISAAPSGVTRSVKQLVNRRQLPNMGALGDVSELLTKSGYGSVRTPLPSPALAPAGIALRLCPHVLCGACQAPWLTRPGARRMRPRARRLAAACMALPQDMQCSIPAAQHWIGRERLASACAATVL